MRGDTGADVAAFTDDVVAGLHEGKGHTRPRDPEETVVIRVFLVEDHALRERGPDRARERLRARRTCRDRGGRGQGREPCVAVHPRPDAPARQGRRRRVSGRPDAVDRDADHQRPTPRVPRRCTLLLGGGVRLDAAGDRALRWRVSRAGGGARTVPRDRAIHRHR